MIPKIISSVPQNGEKNVSIDTPVQMRFSTNISWEALRKSNFVFKNTTKNIEIALSEDSPLINRGLLSITLFPIKKNGHYLEPGCDYQITINEIYDAYGILSSESYEMYFSTEGALPQITEPTGTDLSILFTYPKYGSMSVNPALVRIRFNKELDKNLMNYDQEDSNCVIRVTESELNEETGEYLPIEGEIDNELDERITDITFRPISFIPNTKYTVWINSVISIDNDMFGPYSFSFKTKGQNVWCTESELKVFAPTVISLIGDLSEEELYEKIELVGKSFTEYCKDTNLSYMIGNPEKPSPYFIEYIKSYIIYDIVLNKITSLGTSAQKKSLGDFEVSYTTNMAGLLSL